MYQQPYDFIFCDSLCALFFFFSCYATIKMLNVYARVFAILYSILSYNLTCRRNMCVVMHNKRDLRATTLHCITYWCSGFVALALVLAPWAFTNFWPLHNSYRDSGQCLSCMPEMWANKKTSSSKMVMTLLQIRGPQLNVYQTILQRFLRKVFIIHGIVQYS